MKKNHKGFTLVELLIVIAVIAILAAVAFVAIDPATRFAEARNSQRWSDVSSILEGTQQYIVDNAGTYPTGIVAGETRVIGTGASGCTCTAVAPTDGVCVNLGASLSPKYFDVMPTDPDAGTTTDTDYYMTFTTNNHITIGSCEPELSEVINVTR
ncbi:MAG: prepilin-type N-terminal cleavage/methylation domain-containing protein [Patescibacteria group bacterium]